MLRSEAIRIDEDGAIQPAERQTLNSDLARLADGDRAAAPAVFAALWPVVRAFARNALRNDVRADDVAQQTVVKLFEQASDYDRSKDALAWALEIAAWELRTERRRQQRTREDGWSSAAERVPAAEDPSAEVEGRELREALEQVIGTLSPQDRETLGAVLSGDAHGVTGATFRKRKERALTRLRLAWRRLYEAD